MKSSGPAESYGPDGRWESFEGLIVRCFRGPMQNMLDRALRQGIEALKAVARFRLGRPGG